MRTSWHPCGKPVPDWKIERARKLRSEGLPCQVIAERLGVGMTTIRRYSKMDALYPARPDVSRDCVLKLRRLGLSQYRIAHCLGCSRSMVRRRLRGAP